MSIKSKKNGKTQVEEKNSELKETDSFRFFIRRICIQYDKIFSSKCSSTPPYDELIDREKLREILEKELF